MSSENKIAVSKIPLNGLLRNSRFSAEITHPYCAIMSGMYSTAEAAAFLNMTPKAVRVIAKRKIPGYVSNSFTLDDIQALAGNKPLPISNEPEDPPALAYLDSIPPLPTDYLGATDSATRNKIKAHRAARQQKLRARLVELGMWGKRPSLASDVWNTSLDT